MRNDSKITWEEFVERKKDFSQLLVHLTKDENSLKAFEVLNKILAERKLVALNHHCLFSQIIESELDDTIANILRDNLKSVCFTETPLDLIEVLTKELPNKKFKPKPYGLVFRKDYIREEGGNPVFYLSPKIASPFFDFLFDPIRFGTIKNEEEIKEICKILALINKCDEEVDFHWEREWRVVGDLSFKYSDIYCGLCPAGVMGWFEERYKGIKFIDPCWGLSKLIDALVKP